MMKFRKMKMFAIPLLLIGIVAATGCIATLDAYTQTNVVGLISSQAGAFEGYTLFAPLTSTTTYLIDMNGEIVHTWGSQFSPGNSVYLLDNGSLLRTAKPGGRGGDFNAGGAGGMVQRIAWDGAIMWQFDYSDGTKRLHHDIEMLPNGNVLMISWELINEADVIAQGRNPSLLSDGELWPDTVIEVDPSTDEIVWQWRAWDHLIQDFSVSQPNFGVVADHSELIDLNFANAQGGADWLHINSVDYNAELDQIVLSVHNFSEVWIIDHSTTTAEAASHEGGRYGQGGDLLYRWGNPIAYGVGSANDQQLFVQHDAKWIEDGMPGAGNLLIFNNGTQRGRSYSTVDEIATPINADGSYSLTTSAFGPTSPTWTYIAPDRESFYATNISGAQRLPNGNTLICDGPAGHFFEVTADGDVVWEYINPVSNDQVFTNTEAQSSNDFRNLVFRATRIAIDHPGLANLN
jgi:hypothetical protein